MTRYEEWNNSRWQFTKDRSRWHFDAAKPPQPGKDSFTHVCRFDADFTDAVKKCMPRVQASTWSSRNPDLDRVYSAGPEEADLIRAGADPKMEIFERARADDIEIFQKISQWLGMKESSIKFHNQRTGQMLVEHIDNFAGREERQNSFLETEMDIDPSIMRRFVIMLDDWKLGQVFMLGNAAWTQWRRGDCITWEWRDIPHATCNMGWEDRPMLQITGRVTDVTNERLARVNQDLRVVL